MMVPARVRRSTVDPILTRRVFTRGIVSAAATSSFGRALPAQAGDRSPELDRILADQGVRGCFAGLALSTDRLALANFPRAGQRMIPASTFKIANSLIALETGAVSGDDELFPWDGKPKAFKAWEQDLTLRQAIPASSVPVFQEIARRIGIARYENWLEKLEFGNGATGSDVERFWLDGPLTISAIEQTSFLAALALQQLPMSKRAQSIVRDMLRIETREGRTLFAKTGWCQATTPNIGWWVGWVERVSTPGPLIHTFALNIDMNGPEDLPKRLATGRAMLSALDIY